MIAERLYILKISFSETEFQNMSKNIQDFASLFNISIYDSKQQFFRNRILRAVVMTEFSKLRKVIQYHNYCPC